MTSIYDRFFVLKALTSHQSNVSAKDVYLCIQKTEQTINIVERIQNEPIDKISENEVKLLQAELRVVKQPKDEHQSKLFQWEVDIIAMARILCRDNIVENEFTSLDGFPFMVQAFIAGGTLADYFSRLQGSLLARLSSPFAWHILTTLVQIVHDLHGNPGVRIRHGGILPENVLIDPSESQRGFPLLKLIGFGSAFDPPAYGHAVETVIIAPEDANGLADMIEELIILQPRFKCPELLSILMDLRRPNGLRRFELAHVLDQCKEMRTSSTQKCFSNRKPSKIAGFTEIGYQNVDIINLLRQSSNPLNVGETLPL